MKEQKLYKEIDWIKANKDYIYISKVEADIKMPAGTLQKYVDGVRDLPAKWHDSVHDWVKRFKKNDKTYGK